MTTGRHEGRIDASTRAGQGGECRSVLGEERGGHRARDGGISQASGLCPRFSHCRDARQGCHAAVVACQAPKQIRQQLSRHAAPLRSPGFAICESASRRLLSCRLWTARVYVQDCSGAGGIHGGLCAAVATTPAAACRAATHCRPRPAQKRQELAGGLDCKGPWSGLH